MIGSKSLRGFRGARERQDRRKIVRRSSSVWLLAVLALLLTFAPAIAAAQGQPLSQPEFTPTVLRGIRIPMRDGVNLVADVILPRLNGRFPVILVRTPYGREREANWVERGRFFAARGYAVVVQSVRGRQDSGGEWQPWMTERPDGYDTIDWIARQAWSDGNVGMIGGSYLGSVQLQAAAEAHPALKCIIPYIAGTDPFFQVPFDHGILNLEALPWLHFNVNSARLLDERMPPGANPDRLLTLPLSRADDEWAGRNLAIFDDWLRRDRPSHFAAGNFLEELARRNPRLPILHLSGWWDGAAGGIQRNWARLAQAGNNRQWLVYGFWPHGYSQWTGRETRYADIDYGPASRFEFQQLYLRWFDTWLKGKSVGLDQVPRVQAFMTGANQWLSFPDWSPASARVVSLYLAPGAGSGVGSLSEEAPPGAARPLTYRYDPARVSARRDVNFTRSTRLWFSPDEGDNLLFQTAPLDRDWNVAGGADLELSFSTTARDTDFFALLVDIAPDGQRRAITLPGKMRARYLHGWESPAALEPRRIYRMQFPLRDVAHRFGKGHRIGLAIRSEWFPSFARNLNTIEPAATATRIVIAENSIVTGGSGPSVLRLRVIPTPSSE